MHWNWGIGRAGGTCDAILRVFLFRSLSRRSPCYQIVRLLGCFCIAIIKHILSHYCDILYAIQISNDINVQCVYSHACRLAQTQDELYIHKGNNRITAFYGCTYGHTLLELLPKHSRQC